MKSNIKNIELLNKDFDAQEIKEIEMFNVQLIENAGASMTIERVTGNAVTVQINNINGKRTSKAELLSLTYRTLRKHLPKAYRISIKL